MGQPAAKKGDQIVATDTHIVMIPAPSGAVPTPLPHPFAGIIDGGLSSDVNIMGMPAATVDSTELKRSEEHTSELQSLTNLVCRLLLEKKKKTKKITN